MNNTIIKLFAALLPEIIWHAAYCTYCAYVYLFINTPTVTCLSFNQCFLITQIVSLQISCFLKSCNLAYKLLVKSSIDIWRSWVLANPSTARNIKWNVLLQLFVASWTTSWDKPHLHFLGLVFVAFVRFPTLATFCIPLTLCEPLQIRDSGAHLFGVKET